MIIVALATIALLALLLQVLLTLTVVLKWQVSIALREQLLPSPAQLGTTKITRSRASA